MQQSAHSGQRSVGKGGEQASGFCRKIVCGFTLIELLVVASIIGLLAGLLIPVVSGAIKKGEISKAQHEVTALANAMLQYQSEYNYFPGQATGAGADYKYQVADLQNLLSVLRGTNVNTTWSNPRKMTFLDVDERSVTNGVMVDPWGNPYWVAADWTFDNTISGNIADGGSPGKSVAVWSWGPGSGTNDNITDATHIRSWK